MVVSGTLYTAEQFSFSHSFIPQTVTPVPPTDVPALIRGAVADFWQSPGVISRYAAITSVKLNEIGTDGRYTQSQTVEWTPAAPIAGSADELVPPQIALAVTTTTAFRRGYAHAGRFYLPTPGYTIVNDGRLTAPNVATLGSYLKAYLDGLNTGIGADYELGVVSNVGAGNAHSLTGFKVGRVLDTMRSRRTSLDEEYYIGTLA